MVTRLAIVLALLVSAATPTVWAQNGSQATQDEADPLQGRLVIEVRLEGLDRVSEQLVRNQLRTRSGRPLDWNLVREDLRRLERLGEFSDIKADLAVDSDEQANPNLDVVVIFRMQEAPVVRDVVVVGNRQVTDEAIRQVVSEVLSLLPGIPIDDFQIGSAQRAIEEMYREKGYYQVEVTVDRSELQESGVIAFRVREGERIKITSIRLDGNDAFADRLVRTQIKTRVASIFNKGAISEDGLDADINKIIQFYINRGHLDARASYRLTPSPNGREAIITFLIEEGPLYTLRSIRLQHDTVEGRAPVFTLEQIEGLISIKRGDIFSQKAMRDSIDELSRAYRRLGYVDAQVRQIVQRDTEIPVIDVTISIRQGDRFKAGMVYIQGNSLTQQKVVRREVDIRPDRWLDAPAAEETERRLTRLRLFDNLRNPPKVTIQPEDPSTPGYRDVLVEVEETVTGTLSFGAAVNSDAGVAGRIQLNQRNFDVADVPDSFDELFRGRAFRGGGQTLDIVASPGSDISVYSVSITEPALFDSAYSIRPSLFFRQRVFREFDEDRVGGRFILGRRFGTRWRGSIGLRIEQVTTSDIDSRSASDFFEIEGSNMVTSASFSMTRNTLDNQFRATRGTVTELGIEQVGLLGGDFNYTKLSAQHKVFIPIDEDYLGRKTTISLVGRVGYIVPDDEAPVFERFFLGGRTFRGFRFRGVGPDGLRLDGSDSNDKVGDDWMFFLGAQLERPLWQDMISGVLFIDSGTVTSKPGFDDYRVSVGFGLRLYFPQLGPAPLAFDFGIPLIEQPGDDTQLFSFSVDLPFQ